MSVRPFLASVVLVVLTAHQRSPHTAQRASPPSRSILRRRRLCTRARRTAACSRASTTARTGAPPAWLIFMSAPWPSIPRRRASSMRVPTAAPGFSRVPTEEEPGRSHGPQRRAARHRSPDSHHDLCIADYPLTESPATGVFKSMDAGETWSVTGLIDRRVMAPRWHHKRIGHSGCFRSARFWWAVKDSDLGPAD